MTKTKTGRLNRMIAILLVMIMVCSMLPITSFAEGETAPAGYSYYAVEFSYDDGETTTSYATRDVSKISVSEIVQKLGLSGTVSDVDAYNRFGYYSAGREDGEWYIYTVSVPSSVASAELYTGDLFGGLKSRYHSTSYTIGITIGGEVYPVTLKYIILPSQLNDPGSVEGVTMGDTIYTFASGMPLSTVYIDNDYFQIPTGHETLTDEPGFVFRVPSDFPVVPPYAGLSCNDQEWAIYDPTVDGATPLETGKENRFDGDLFSFTFANAAILSDGAVANVKITYSDARITIDDRATEENGGFPYSISLACGKVLDTKANHTGGASTDIDGEKYSTRYSAAVTMKANIQIVDDDGNPIDGSFICCVEGINIIRQGSQATKPLYNGYLYDYWSEAIQVNGGRLSDIYVRPNDDEMEPGPDDLRHQRYYPYVTKNDEGIKFTATAWSVQRSSIDPDTGEEVETVSTAWGENYYYSAGFVTTADAKNGIQMRSYSAGTLQLSFETTYMNGYSIWHRIRSSSTRGGTIQTTTEGNVGGFLSDGGIVLEPGTYVVPDGKTVVYTMTPEKGYVLDSVTVKSDSLSYSGGEDVTAVVTPVYGENGAIAYYTYTFPADTENPQNNHENQAIHVKWKKSTSADLTVHKTAVGGDGTFTFHIKVNGEQPNCVAWKEVAYWETEWREHYSFAHITTYSSPLVLDGITYYDDVEQMSLTDDSAKLLLSGSFGEPITKTDEGKLLTDEDGNSLTLYKVSDEDGNPYTITIYGTVYDLYSDSKDWAVSGETGSNAANFWILDEEDKIDNYSNISIVSEDPIPKTVNLSESPYNGTPVPGKPDYYEFTVTTTDGEGSLTLTKLPYGYHYSVDELTPDGWKLTNSIYTDGDLTSDKTAAFTNLRPGDLIVTKTLAGNDTDSSKEFNFTITLSDTTINGEYSGVAFTNGVATITLKGGESKTIEGLPNGTGYEVSEADYSADGYKTSSSSDTGTIDEHTPAVAAFTNTRDTYGDLVVTKTVEGNAPIADAEFSFTVTLSDTSITGTYGEMNFENGIATFTLKNGESKTASNLPNGITYEVTEADYTSEGYVTTKTDDTGTIVGDDEVTAAFKNTRNADGSLTVTKTLAGNDTDSTKGFEFTITLSDTTVNGEYSGVAFTNGVATVTLKGGESKTIEGLPNGTGYEVTEADYSDDGYVATYTGDTDTIDENAPKVASFTNTRDTYGDLVVTKTVAGNAASTTKEFTFTVTLSDKTVTGTYGDMTFENGVATFKLKHDESKTATGLPNGVGYTVVESDNRGYTVTKTGDTGSIIGGETVTAAFTNTKNTTPPPDDPSDDPKTGNLTVSKTVAGNGADQNKEFTFTVTLSRKISGTYGGMTFTNGIATFTLKHGESKKATGLPEGITYEVTEADYSADGYVTTKTGDSGKIVANGTATAAFTNTKNTTPPPPDNPPDDPEYGDLTVKKTVTGDLANKDQYFTFTITFNASGSYSYTGSKSGTIKSGDTVQLKHGESITISGLPAGTTYSVTESGNNGYRVYASGNTGTIAANKTSTAAFTNARSSVPQTGDDSNLLLWLSTAGAAGVGMVLTAILGKKRKGKHVAAK
jgi:hypothetical protein